VAGRDHQQARHGPAVAQRFVEQAHRLNAKDERAKLSAKRVLGLLVDGDLEREARCWLETSLETLRARGEESGLREYLDEVRQLALQRVLSSSR
jgi:hypothetical protein